MEQTGRPHSQGAHLGRGLAEEPLSLELLACVPQGHELGDGVRVLVGPVQEQAHRGGHALDGRLHGRVGQPLVLLADDQAGPPQGSSLGRGGGDHRAGHGVALVLHGLREGAQGEMGNGCGIGHRLSV